MEQKERQLAKRVKVPAVPGYKQLAHHTQLKQSAHIHHSLSARGGPQAYRSLSQRRDWPANSRHSQLLFFLAP